MDFYADYDFAKAWKLSDNRYLLTFYDGTTKEFKNKRCLQFYVLKLKKKLSCSPNQS